MAPHEAVKVLVCRWGTAVSIVLPEHERTYVHERFMFVFGARGTVLVDLARGTAPVIVRHGATMSADEYELRVLPR